MVNFKKISPAFLILTADKILDKILSVITVVFIVSGVVFFFGFITKVFIVNQSIFKLNVHEQHQFLILKKCLNGK